MTVSKRVLYAILGVTVFVTLFGVWAISADYYNTVIVDTTNKRATWYHAGSIKSFSDIDGSTTTFEVNGGTITVERLQIGFTNAPYIDIDGSNNLEFYDTVTGSQTLADLVGSFTNEGWEQFFSTEPYHVKVDTNIYSTGYGSFTYVYGDGKYLTNVATDTHNHDGDTLQIDGINSDGGTFSFDTTGTVDFSSHVIVTGTMTVEGSGLSINNVDYEWPSSDGTADYVLHTDGAGTLTWDEDSGGAAGDIQSFVDVRLSANVGGYGTGVWGIVPFDTELADLNDEFSTVTSSFTASTSGYYLIILQIDSDCDDGDTVGAAIYIGGTQGNRTFLTVGGGTEQVVKTSAVRDLDIGDTVAGHFYHDHGSDRTVYGGGGVYTQCLLTITKLNTGGIDDLGNHVATTTLVMGGYDISTSSGITGLKKIIWDDGTVQVSSPSAAGGVITDHIELTSTGTLTHAEIDTQLSALDTSTQTLETTKLSTTTAESTYLTQSSATATYLQLSSAAATYLQKSSATASYLTKSSATATYLYQSSATVNYVNANLGTTQGDILYYDSGWKRLGIGSAGEVLEVAAGGIPEWDTDDSGGAGSSTLQVKSAGVEISSPTASLDFVWGFTGTESPSTEANITLDTDTLTAEYYVLNPATATLDMNSQAISGAATLDTGQGAYELYAMDQDVETTDAVTFSTVDTGNGAYELFAMNQDVESTDDVDFVEIDVASMTTTQNDVVYIASNTYTVGYSSDTNTYSQSYAIGSHTFDSTEFSNLDGQDQSVKTTDSVTFSTVDTGNGAYELHAMNQDVESTDAVTFATVDTGEGANELFDMNQNVMTTSSVTFSSCTISNSISINGLDYTFPSSDGTSGQVLHTDGSLTLTWDDDDTAAGGGDNLGSHIATQTLTMAGFDIDNAGDVTASSFTIGANILDTNEWANLDGINQSLATTDTPTFAQINTGIGNTDVYIMNQNLQTIDDVSFGTVNTGQGANELYDMDQNVQTTDSPTFVGLTLNSVAYTFPADNGDNGEVLHTDGAGALTWGTDDTAAGGGDNLGSHIATQTLTMAGFDIVVNTITCTSGEEEIYISSSVEITGDLTIVEGKLADNSIVSADIKDDTIDSADYAAGSIDAEHLAADIIDETKIADDGIDSEHYNADSIDNEHVNWADIDYLDDEGAVDIAAYDAVGTFESGDTFLVLEAGVGIREADYDDLPSGSSDDLGNHVATTTLNMAGFDIDTADQVDVASMTTTTNDAIYIDTHTYTVGTASAAAGSFDTELEIPNSNAPTTDRAGEIALDTTITDHQPLLQYYDGDENMTVIALPTANLNSTDNYIIKYDAGDDEFKMEADTGEAGASEINIMLNVHSAKLPSSNPAVINGASNYWQLLFDDSTDESATWDIIIDDDYGSGTLYADLYYTMTSTDTNEVVWNVSIMAVTEADSADVDTDSYDSVNISTDTVPSTAGYLGKATVTLTNDDSLAASDYVRIKISRDADAADDDAPGDAELIKAIIRE